MVITFTVVIVAAALIGYCAGRLIPPSPAAPADSGLRVTDYAEWSGEQWAAWEAESGWRTVQR